MQYAKKIAIPAAILLVLVIALVLATQLGGGEDTTATTTVDETDFVYYAEEADVARYELENEFGTVNLEKSVDTDEDGNESVSWSVTTPEHPGYDMDLVEDLADSLRAVVAISTISEAPEDLSVYGLDEPVARVTIFEEDGDTPVLLLGNLAGSGTNYYAMMEGETTVYTITTSKGGDLQRRAMEMLQTALCSVAYEDIKTFSMERDSDAYRISLKSSWATDADGNPVELQWALKEPIQWTAETTPVQLLVEEVIASYANGFVTMDPDADLSQFGLDDPQYYFEIEDANQVYTITIGSSAGSGDLFGMCSRLPNVVFTTPASNFTQVEVTIPSLTDSFIYLPMMADVAEVRIELDGDVIDVELDATIEPNVYIVNGEDANIENSKGQNYFKSFFQAIISGTMEGLEPDAEPSSDDPVLTIDYGLHDGSNVTVTYVARDAYTLYAFVDGEYTGVYISSDVLDNTNFGVGNALPKGLRPAYQGLLKAIRYAEDGVFN